MTIQYWEQFAAHVALTLVVAMHTFTAEGMMLSRCTLKRTGVQNFNPTYNQS